MRTFLIATLAGVVLYSSWCTRATAGHLVNGGFEDDLAGWQTLGRVSVVGRDFGSGPVEGGKQVLLESGDPFDTASNAELYDFLGLSGGEIDALSTAPQGSVIGGSALKQTFQALAGDVLTFDFNYLTGDDVANPTPDFNDFAFVLVNGVSLLADSYSPGFSSSSAGFAYETGYRSVSYTILAPGDYTLGFGVVNVGDGFFNSALIVDNVRVVRAVPEPHSLALCLFAATFIAGAGGLCRTRCATDSAGSTRSV